MKPFLDKSSEVFVEESSMKFPGEVLEEFLEEFSMDFQGQSSTVPLKDF